MSFSEWREKRKAKKEERKDLYDTIEHRLKKKLLELDEGTDEFKEIQRELRENNQIRAESRESKRRISKSDKGGIIIKTLSILGGAFGIGSIIWAEKEGMVFTGEKRSIMDAICRGLGNVFVRK